MGVLDPTTIALVAAGGMSGLVAVITATSTFLRDRFKFNKSQDALTVTVTDREGNVIATLLSSEDDRVQKIIKEIAAIGDAENIQEDSRADQAPREMVDLGDLEGDQSNPGQARDSYRQVRATRRPDRSAGGSLSDVRFLTVAEVATIMRVSKMTVYKLIHEGSLEAIRRGRSFRIPHTAIDEYLRQVNALNKARR